MNTQSNAVLPNHSLQRTCPLRLATHTIVGAPLSSKFVSRHE